MKLKIKEINANPFKENINKGKLNEQNVKKIQSNLKELGLMGALPVFKKDNKYYLIAGHHRVEAVKRTFGSNYEIDVIIHNYSEENVLRGMIVENLTQRSDELLEVTENLNCIRKYLKTTKCSDAEQMVKRPQGGGHQPEAGSIRNIGDWLNKNGTVMSIGKISEYLKVFDNLDRSLLKKAENSSDGKEEGKIGIEDAKNLARVDKQDQKIIKERLDETGLDYKEKSKLVTEYLNADDTIKEDIKEGKILIKDIAEVKIEKEIAKNNTEKIEFIPNFKTRLDTFSTEVVKLEQQVALFRKVFYSGSFSKRYNSLGNNEKTFLDTTIQGIRQRIKKCYDDVEFFASKIKLEDK